MTRVHVVVEGPTEESFIRNALAPTLWDRQIYLNPIILGVPGHKGGRVNYPRVKKDVVRLLKGDQGAYCTTMLDFYGLGNGFPGTPVSPATPSIDKVAHIEQEMKNDIALDREIQRPDIRYLPYLQLHEYEALLFSDCDAFATGIKCGPLSSEFQRIRRAFPTPEDINDGFDTAPSKRILLAYPHYRKPLDGTLGALAVGIAKMRQECPHFRDWVDQLKAL